MVTEICSRRSAYPNVTKIVIWNAILFMLLRWSKIKAQLGKRASRIQHTSFRFKRMSALCIFWYFWFNIIVSLRHLLYCILWAYSLAAWLEINILLTFLLTYSLKVANIVKLAVILFMLIVWPTSQNSAWEPGYSNSAYLNYAKKSGSQLLLGNASRMHISQKWL